MTKGASIFIGYRRQDSQGFAGRVADDLIDHFGSACIFRDDDIPEGADFTQVLDQALSGCSILIAVIGPHWLKVQDGQGRPRLFLPDDWVRREIEVALVRGIRVLPILVGNATMPAAQELPETLQPIAKIQAVSLSDRRWEQDLKRLVSLLEKHIPALKHIALTSHQHDAVGIGQAPTLRDSLEKLAKTISYKRSVKRSRISLLALSIKALLVRTLWIVGVLLIGWYGFENHATPELRKEVFDFLTFTHSKFKRLMNWFGTV